MGEALRPVINPYDKVELEHPTSRFFTRPTFVDRLIWRGCYNGFSFQLSTRNHQFDSLMFESPNPTFESQKKVFSWLKLQMVYLFRSFDWFEANVKWFWSLKLWVIPTCVVTRWFFSVQRGFGFWEKICVSWKMMTVIQLYARYMINTLLRCLRII